MRVPVLFDCLSSRLGQRRLPGTVAVDFEYLPPPDVFAGAPFGWGLTVVAFGGVTSVPGFGVGFAGVTAGFVGADGFVGSGL